MDIVSTFAPPRICYFGGEPVWLRPYTAEDFALLIAWLDDVIPGRADRKTPPPLSGDEARGALESEVGFTVVCYAALRHLGHDYAASCGMAAAAVPEERIRIYDVLFARRRYRPQVSGGEDLAESWWGPNVIAMAERFRTAVDAVGRLTLDQIDCYATGGAEDEDPGAISVDEMQARWEATRAAKEAVAEPVGATE